MKDLIILSGNPGSGKSTIADLLARDGSIILRIDDFYLKAPRDLSIVNWFEDQGFLDAAYAEFEAAVVRRLSRQERIVIETTGVGNRWKQLRLKLEQSFKDRMVMIHLKTSRETSLQRIRVRNMTDHAIKMSDEDVERFFALGKDRAPEGAQEVDADRPLEEVFAEIRRALG